MHQLSERILGQAKELKLEKLDISIFNFIMAYKEMLNDLGLPHIPEGITVIASKAVAKVRKKKISKRIFKVPDLEKQIHVTGKRAVSHQQFT
jgi:hypothetical protein